MNGDPIPPTSKKVDTGMHARSLLRQANCPECGRRGWQKDALHCPWCIDRLAVIASIENEPSQSPSETFDYAQAFRDLRTVAELADAEKFRQAFLHYARKLDSPLKAEGEQSGR